MAEPCGQAKEATILSQSQENLRASRVILSAITEVIRDSEPETKDVGCPTAVSVCDEIFDNQTALNIVLSQIMKKFTEKIAKKLC